MNEGQKWYEQPSVEETCAVLAEATRDVNEDRERQANELLAEIERHLESAGVEVGSVGTGHVWIHVRDRMGDLVMFSITCRRRERRVLAIVAEEDRHGTPKGAPLELEFEFDPFRKLLIHGGVQRAPDGAHVVRAIDVLAQRVVELVTHSATRGSSAT